MLENLSRALTVASSQYKARQSVVLYFWWIYLRILKLIRIGLGKTNTPDETFPVSIVIPLAEKDIEILTHLVPSLRRIRHKIVDVNIISRNSERIIAICRSLDIHFVDEATLLGFDKDEIHYSPLGVDRSGWVFQQLLKLSAYKICKCDDYIVIDADTILVRDIQFRRGSKYIFYASEEWHRPYFNSFFILFKYRAPSRWSLTSHMMIFNRQLLAELQDELVRIHNTPWHVCYLQALDQTELSSISDYDTYANWVLARYPSISKILPLHNTTVNRSDNMTGESFDAYSDHYHSVSLHSYL